MKISIITVVYNNKRTIQTAIDSVLGQTYKNIEYIVIDGGSKDGTKEILIESGNNISKLISEPDNGIYDAMNKGLKLATGDVIGILNSDDMYYDSHVIEDVMNRFANDNTLDAVYGDLEYVKSDDVTKVVRTWISLEYYDHFFEDGNVPPHTSLFLKRNVYLKGGYFNLNLKLAADYELMLRFFKKLSFNSVYINRTMVKMRLGGATNKSLKNVFVGNMEILESWKINGWKAPLKLMPSRFFKRLVQFL